MLKALRSLFRLLPHARQRQLIPTLGLMLAGAAAELVTIGAALPFLALIAAPDSELVPPQLLAILKLAGGSAVVGAAILLILAAIVAGAVRMSLLWVSQRFVMGMGHDIAASLFSNMLRQPYAVHVQRNSSQTLAAVEKVQGLVFGVLQPAMQGLAATVLAFFVITLLLFINFVATGLAALFLGAVYVAANRFSRAHLRRNAEHHASTIGERTETVQQAIGGIRDIILDRSEPLLEARFNDLDQRYRLSQVRNQFLSAAPRHVIEAAGLIGLAVATVAMSARPGGVVEAIPVLGALALGAQRLLPLLQQAYHGWSQLNGHYRLLLDVLELLQAAPPDHAGKDAEPLRFGREVAFAGVSFGYEGSAPTLDRVDFRIAAGEHVGIAGLTGSGKSTLLDLLMGLLQPSEGEILVDGAPLAGHNRAAWQAGLAHVPQAIYLVDDTIAANIVFPRPESEVDQARMAQAVQAAQLAPYIAGLPHGLATRVGERGVRLSGGQRQRIGIARALYRRPRLLILDEATNALDEQTEQHVLAAIAGFEGVTVVTVSHRPSTLAQCQRVLRVEAQPGGPASVREVPGCG
jgi:ABC-type multidrug transport system fused ATPase/permease subunit